MIADPLPLGAIAFLQPLVLLLLLALPPLFWLAWRQAHGVRRTLSLGLRFAAIAALVLALARPRLGDELHRLAVAFLLDVSESIPAAERDRALELIERRFAEIPEGDQAALILFGDRPSVEIPFTGSGGRGDAGLGLRLDRLESRLDRLESDLARAVAFAEGTFPEGCAQRIVLISDGNETRGDLEGAARALKAAGLRLDALPIRYSYEDEVIVEGLQGAGFGRIGEPVQLRAVISSQAPVVAEVALLEDGELLGDPQEVELERGANALRFSPVPTIAGYHQYELRVRPRRDGNPANNVGRMGLIVGGPPQVQVVSRPGYDERLAQALGEAGVATTRATPGELPHHPAGYVNVDTLVLDNVPAWELDEVQLHALKGAVQELGMGLVIVGGDLAFGPGGYRGTPLEELLPVDLDSQNRKTMPKGALVIVLHSIEFDSGNTWAVRICKAALRGLSPEDEAGIVYYDGTEGERWLFELSPLTDRARKYELIDGVFVGDMVSFHNCFVLAERALLGSDAALKHLVVISDGDPQMPSPALVARLVANKVTVSTICINPHVPADAGRMKDLATACGGRYYRLDPTPDGLAKLPELMFKEAATLRRSALREEPFTPIILLGSSPLLRGLDGSFPELAGYVVTSMKADAETILLADEEERDPLLAAHYSGLGRVVAFTSDASSRWAKGWLGWGKFGPFWAQILRSTIAQIDPSPYPLRVRTAGNALELQVAAAGEDGEAVTDLEVRAQVLGGGEESRGVEFEQRQAGRYVARVDGLEQGHYLVRAEILRGAKRSRALAVGAIDFAPEYRSLRSDEERLRTAARVTGGSLVEDLGGVFAHDFSAVRGLREIWPWFVALAALLLLLDLLARRLDIDPLRAFAERRRQRREAAVATAVEAPAEAPPGPRAKLPEASVPTGEKKRGGERPPRPPAPESAGTLDQLKEAKERASKRREWH